MKFDSDVRWDSSSLTSISSCWRPKHHHHHHHHLFGLFISWYLEAVTDSSDQNIFWCWTLLWSFPHREHLTCICVTETRLCLTNISLILHCLIFHAFSFTTHVFVFLYTVIYWIDLIHFISNRSAIMFMFVFQTLPVIFSCTKQLVMLLDTAKPAPTFNEVS